MTNITSQKKRVVVALQGKPGTGSWETRLPPCITTDTHEVLITTAPKAYRDGSNGAVKNFDLLIDFTFDGFSDNQDILEVISPKDVIKINRRDKHNQITHGVNIIPLTRDGASINPQPLTASAYVVARPQNGARSMAIFTIDTSRISLYRFFHLFDSIMQDSNIAEKEERLQTFLKNVQASPGGVVFHSGEEWYPGEAISLMPTRAAEYVFSEYNPAIITEYRGFVNGQGKIFALQKRECVGEPSAILRYPANVEIEPMSLCEENEGGEGTFPTLQVDPAWHYQAIDIFTYGCRSEPAVGVFEHSPEFGVDVMSPSDTALLYRKLLFSAIKEWEDRYEAEPEGDRTAEYTATITDIKTKVLFQRQVLSEFLDLAERCSPALSEGTRVDLSNRISWVRSSIEACEKILKSITDKDADKSEKA